MSTDDWLIDKHLCRCCHSEGKFKSLTDPMIENEMLYIEALRICLDIKLNHVEGALESAASGICDECATKLQDVFTFWKQVLRCEESFLSFYSQNRIKLASSEPVIEIKEELTDPEDSDCEDKNGDDLELSAIEEDSNCEDQDGVKLELPVIKEVPEPKKAPIKKKKKSPRAPKKAGPKSRQKAALEDKDKCGKTKTKPYELLVTDYEHTGDSTRCSGTYKSIDNLRFHIEGKHLTSASETKYNCTLCNKKFKTPVPFIKHKLDEHNIDDRFECNACEKLFPTKRRLLNHKNVFHMLGNKHKCSQCDYESFCSSTLAKHKWKHKAIKDYHCKFCKKSFVRRSTLELHERIHTGDRRKVCAECGKAFVQKASLNYHMTKYHPEVKF